MGSNRKAVVGAFVIAGTILFAFALFLIGDRRLLFAHREAPVQSDELLRGVVDGGPEAELRGRSLHREVPGVRPAHPLRNLEVLGRPALRAPAAGRIERQTRVVSVHAASVFVAREWPPHAGEIHLRLRG